MPVVHSKDPPSHGGQQPRLLDQVRQASRTRHDNLRTEATDGQWIRRFILGHHTRHPQDMGAATPHQAVRAIWLLYQAGLKADLGWLDEDDVRTVQAWLGHQDVTTTMIDTHVLNHGG